MSAMAFDVAAVYDRRNCLSSFRHPEPVEGSDPPSRQGARLRLAERIGARSLFDFRGAFRRKSCLLSGWGQLCSVTGLILRQAQDDGVLERGLFAFAKFCFAAASATESRGQLRSQTEFGNERGRDLSRAALVVAAVYDRWVCALGLRFLSSAVVDRRYNRNAKCDGPFGFAQGRLRPPLHFERGGTCAA